MRKNHNIASILLLLLIPVSGVFTERRDSGGFVQHAAAEASDATHEVVSQKEPEAIACQRAVRLNSRQLLDLVITRAPLAPPAMLHNSKLHGKVTVEVSLDEMGTVISVRGVSGHPFAIASAVESVRKWTFMSFKRQGEARCALGSLTLSYDFRS